MERLIPVLDKNAPAPMLDAPIPGQGMTAPLGGRPWQQPPRFPTAEQALSFYVDKISEERQTDQLMDLLELGVPIDTLVDTLQLGGVMEGLHSVDVGIILTPALAETVEQMAKAADVDYTLTSEDEKDTLPTKSEVALGMKYLKEKPRGILIDDLKDNPVEETEEAPVPEEKSMGLMARRG
tara:strand:+ start:21 stop:563 length:543 start_codon:yes stop_codon:yes gene_type:complete